MTHFDWLVDGSIVGLYLLATMIAGLMVRRYIGKVEDFLVAGREMKVYLGVASLAATEFGIVTCMYTAQAGYKYGFAGATPGLCQAAAMMVIGLTGFCIKPLRDSGVMTLPELFERRFGRGVRRTAGVVIVLGGLLNMGVFLRIGGEFLMLVTGFDVGYLELAMTALLLMVAVYTILGGMLSVLITDFLQFVVMSAGLILVTILVLKNVGWGTLVDTVEKRIGPGGTNPFVHPDLGWTYVVFQLLLNVAATLTWQAVIARVLASKDSKTGRQVFTRTSFFFVCRFVIPGLWGIAALATLAPAAYSVLPPSMAKDPSLHAMPLFLSSFVPVGMMGVLVAAMLAADMSTDSSYMLTWASVIYNDVIAPFRRKDWSEKKGLILNRSIVAAIGVFLLLYGLWYPLEGNLWDYLTVTGTIYLSSMSVLLVACCYWKRANSWGAVAAIVCGAAFPISFLVMQKLDGTRHFANVVVGPYWSGILAYAVAAIGMIVGSMLKPGERSAAA
jgi:SSS family solute:Na+ symporter